MYQVTRASKKEITNQNTFYDPLWDKKEKLAKLLMDKYGITFVEAMQAVNYVVLNPWSQPGETYTIKAENEIKRRIEKKWIVVK